MKPLICFFEKDLFIFSQDYELLKCPDSLTTETFLQEVDKKYFDQLKVVQANFEYDDVNLFKNQKTLYSAAKAVVFIIRGHEIKSLPEIKKITGAQPAALLPFKPLITKNEFIEKVKSVQTDIMNGRIYQANLTAPLVSESSTTGLNLFFEYESQFQSEYKALLPVEDFDLVSFSPELFLESRAGELSTRPIKGSSTAASDFNFSLYKNKKEEAELSMIVDLLRNDLNSLGCDEAAVVTEHRSAMQLGYIQHTYSEIKIKNAFSLPHVLNKMMPGGSISGCPKLESLKVISELEKYKRQAYTGTIGWWQKNEFKLNLAIRTFVRTPGAVIYHAGCGIVFDSDPELEWKEFLLKTGGLCVES